MRSYSRTHHSVVVMIAVAVCEPLRVRGIPLKTIPKRALARPVLRWIFPLHVLELLLGDYFCRCERFTFVFFFEQLFNACANELFFKELLLHLPIKVVHVFHPQVVSKRILMFVLAFPHSSKYWNTDSLSKHDNTTSEIHRRETTSGHLCLSQSESEQLTGAIT